MPFCGNCGVQLYGSENFCGQCGTPVLPYAGTLSETPENTQSAQLVPLAGGNMVLDVLQNAEIVAPSGASDMFTLVFTDTQVIVAKLTGEIIGEMQQKARVKSKAEGNGWLARTREVMKASGAVGESYREMAPRQILNETPGNFVVFHAAVGSVNIRDVRESSNQDVSDDCWTELSFNTVGGSIKCRLRKQNKDLTAFLNSFYPGRVTGRN